MRCAICGTENAPDSKFCGGCGARVSGVSNRLAPTVKVTDAAKYPDPVPHDAPQRAQSGPVRVQPPSMPPPISIAPAPAPAPAPPAPAPARPAAAAPTPSPRSSHSVSAIKPRRRAWVGIIAVIDLGLAAAGGYLLHEGLRGDAVAVPATAPIAVPTPAPAPLVPPGTTGAPKHAPGAEVKHAAPVPTPAPSPVPPSPSPVTPPLPVGSGSAHVATATAPGPHPVDPYPESGSGSGSGSGSVDIAAIADDLDRVASVSHAISDHCYTQATKGLPADQALRGTVRIQLVVNPDGTISHATTAANTTGSDQLASCMLAEVGAWVLHPHSGPAVELIKQFGFQPQ